MTSTRLTSRASSSSIGFLALLAYLPALLTKPGRMPTDTKLYLYLDPGRLISDAPFTWDTRQFGGWVPHQTIAYLWPQGPWYWICQHLAVPDWIAHRLWIGSLLFLGACGVMWVGRLLGLDRAGALVAAVLYGFSPYVLPYLSRTSAMLLPWAALGWIVGLTIKSATSERRWRHPALLALVLLSCSAVNATAVMMIAPAPVLWLAHAVLQRTITVRRALATSLRIGVLAIAVSLWWIFMLRAQSTWGADVLAYSESLQATSLTSTSNEAIRGLGYWLFYVRDPYAFTTTASTHYIQSGIALVVSFGLAALCMVGLWTVRWSQRRYAALLVFVGIVLAVGVHPIENASPLMSALAGNSRSSLALAIRSSTRALPMSNLGLALGAGALVTALASTRLRWRALAPGVVIALALANFPVLWNGGMVDPALERDENPPAAWQEAAAALSATSPEYRVMQLPGSEFGAFRWGYTVDPPLPGMTTKPLITRDLLPLGSPGVMDLLYSLDDKIQSRTLDRAALAPVARFLGVDQIWIANDLAFDRFRTPRPIEAASDIRDAPDIGPSTSYGTTIHNEPDIPMIDEHAVIDARDSTASVPAVELAPVLSPVPIVRAAANTVLVAGSGDGVVAATGAGLLHGDEAVVYSADHLELHQKPSLVIITDSNRDRAHHWRSSQDVTGYTESGGTVPEALHKDEGDQRLPVFSAQTAADQTISTFDDPNFWVRATAYGEPFAYRPEDRPSMAVDGDPSTAWLVADRADPIGQAIEVSETSGSLTLVQPQNPAANRRISRVVVSYPGSSASPSSVELTEASLAPTGQRIAVNPSLSVRVEIAEVTPVASGTDVGPSAVGFAELGVGTHLEWIRTPAVDTPADTPVAVVLSRERVDPLNRWRSDPERVMRREFSLTSPFEVTGTARIRVDTRASDDALNQLLGVTGAVANRRLTGDANSRGIFATDGDPSSAWATPFGTPVGSSLTLTATKQGVGGFTLQQPLDEFHSLIVAVSISQGGRSFDASVGHPDEQGRSEVSLPQPLAKGPFTLTITRVAERTTLDRRYGEPTVLPAAIADLSGDGIGVTEFVGGDHAPFCALGYLTIDGGPAGVEMDEDAYQSLRVGETIERPLCTSDTAQSLSLAAGSHRLETTPPAGLQIDTVVLRSPGSTASATPPTVDVHRTRLTRTATVSGCPNGCWLILGEGYNRGWSASIDGHDLGAAVQVAGGFNGWWLEGSEGSVRVDMEWKPQTPVTIAILLSVLGTLLCLWLAWPRRGRDTSAPLRVAPPRFTRESHRPVGLVVALVASASVVALAALVASPSTLTLAAVPAAVVLVSRRPRSAGAAGTILSMALAAQIVHRQIQHRWLADAAWPIRFDDLHRAGIVVVVLLLVGALFDRSDQSATG